MKIKRRGSKEGINKGVDEADLVRFGLTAGSNFTR
jgi:hypothetical protein